MKLHIEYSTNNRDNIIKLNTILANNYEQQQQSITMVRKYKGDISGHFWFAMQGSGDISNLIKIKESDMYRWRGCGCIINESALEYLDYCKQCYDCKDDCIVDVWKKTGKDASILYEDAKQICYNIFADDHLAQLENSLICLRSIIDKRILNEVDKVENLPAILNASSGIFDDVLKIYNEIHKTMPIVANPDFVSRYCLGVQIKYRLKTSGSCYVICEL